MSQAFGQEGVVGGCRFSDCGDGCGLFCGCGRGGSRRKLAACGFAFDYETVDELVLRAVGRFVAVGHAVFLFAGEYLCIVWRGIEDQAGEQGFLFGVFGSVGRYESVDCGVGGWCGLLFFGVEAAEFAGQVGICGQAHFFDVGSGNGQTPCESGACGVVQLLCFVAQQ